MARQHGQLDLDAAIPRVRFAPEQGESTAAYMARIAAATAFAYAMPPDQFERQPGFSYLVDTLVLPAGVISRGSVRGRVRLTRDAALAATGADSLFIYLLLSGSATVRQGRHRRAIIAGDIFIHDLAEPAEIAFDGYELLLLVVGRGALPEAVRERHLDGAVVPHDHPLAVVVTGLIASIHAGAARLRPAHAGMTLDAALTLLCAALAEVAVGNVVLPVKAAAEAIIDGCLDDPALSPGQLSERLGVSRATLYRAFQAYGGVRRVIADRRVHHAWVLCTERPVPSPADVAKRCGYRSIGHLDQAMKAVFGLNARELGVAGASSAAAGAADVMSNDRRRFTGGL